MLLKVYISHFILKQKIKLEYFDTFLWKKWNSFFYSSIMKNIVFCCSRLSVKYIYFFVLLLDQHQVFVVSLNLLLPFYNNLWIIVQQTSSWVTTSLTCCFLLIILIILLFVLIFTFNWLIKKFFPSIIKVHSFISTFWRYIFCILFCCPHFQRIKQKVFIPCWRRYFKFIIFVWVFYIFPCIVNAKV